VGSKNQPTLRPRKKRDSECKPGKHLSRARLPINADILFSPRAGSASRRPKCPPWWTQNASAILSKIGKVLLLGGGACILVTVMVSIATAIYELMVVPTDMHLLGLLTTLLMFAVAPIGGVALTLGVLLRFIAHVVIGEARGRHERPKGGEDI
jgi:hypothetical protein